jgi:hypothetical protein
LHSQGLAPGPYRSGDRTNKVNARWDVFDKLLSSCRKRCSNFRHEERQTLRRVRRTRFGGEARALRLRARNAAAQ